eukprot:scaffold246907_cov18-Tisochrysis_lutea.AAC.1
MAQLPSPAPHLLAGDLTDLGSPSLATTIAIDGSVFAKFGGYQAMLSSCMLELLGGLSYSQCAPARGAGLWSGPKQDCPLKIRALVRGNSFPCRSAATSAGSHQADTGWLKLGGCGACTGSSRGSYAQEQGEPGKRASCYGLRAAKA